MGDERLEFSFDNNIPIYMQISRIIEMRIISGELSPGERLPSVRDLAIELKANPNTVQRALSELENEGLIYTERTNGKFVTENISHITEHKMKYATSLAQEYLNNMQKIGFDKTCAIDMLGGNNQWKKS